MKYITQTIVTIPSAESMDTTYLGASDPQGESAYHIQRVPRLSSLP